MYQTSIRNKKQKKILNNSQNNNYTIDNNNEDYACVKKLLGNCRALLYTNSGNECIGIIRGSLRKFTKRVLIEKCDIVVVSIRDYQLSKVDIVHKYNREQIQELIKEKKLSQSLINFYNNKVEIENKNETLDNELEFNLNITYDNTKITKKNNDNYIQYSDDSDESDKSDKSDEGDVSDKSDKSDKSDILNISDI